MKVIEHYAAADEPLISYEIIPPRRGGSIDDILKIVEALLPYKPPFIDVTSHAAEAYYEEMPENVVRRHVKRKPVWIGPLKTGSMSGSSSSQMRVHEPPRPVR